MSDDEERQEAVRRMHEIVGGWPEEIWFWGGPYDGAILIPRNGTIYDVHRRDVVERAIPLYDLPPNFIPIDDDRLVLHHPKYGDALYVYDVFDKRWSFREFVELEDGPDAA